LMNFSRPILRMFQTRAHQDAVNNKSLKLCITERNFKTNGHILLKGYAHVFLLKRDST